MSSHLISLNSVNVVSIKPTISQVDLKIRVTSARTDISGHSRQLKQVLHFDKVLGALLHLIDFAIKREEFRTASPI